MVGDTVTLEKVQLGVIGLGSVFEPYASTIRELSHEGRLVVTSICDSVETRAIRGEDFLQQSLPFTTDYRAIIDRDDVDAVLILTSMPYHGEIASAALSAGKHVLVEKPMSIHLDEARSLVAQAATGSELLVCAPHVVLSPTFKAMWKQVVHDGEIGTVLTARARYGWSGPTWGQWYYSTGGGPLFDLGVYNITTLTGLMGSVRRVTAFAGIAIPEREVEGEQISVENPDNYQILLDFGDARFASVTTGFTLQAYRTPAIELYGSTGVAQMLGDDWAPQGYEMMRNDAPGWTIFGESEPTWPWTAGLRHLVDCLVDGAELLVQPGHAYHCLEVMLKAQVAVTTGEAQTISSTIEPIPYDVDSIYVQQTGRVSHDSRIRRHREDSAEIVQPAR